MHSSTKNTNYMAYIHCFNSSGAFGKFLKKNQVRLEDGNKTVHTVNPINMKYK